VAVDEAYAEFVGRTVLPLRFDYPRLVVVRTLSKAHALAGARVGFAVARPETLAPILSFGRRRRSAPSRLPSPPPLLSRPELAAANVARIAEQRPGSPRELAASAGGRTRRSRTSSSSGSARPGAAARRRALLRAGLVPRTFGPDHPFADCLRLTVRSAEENDRLIEAARGSPHEQPSAPSSPPARAGRPSPAPPRKRRSRSRSSSTARARRTSRPASASSTTCSTRWRTTPSSTSTSPRPATW
jgi:histidinol-phosphate aminotransferase